MNSIAKTILLLSVLFSASCVKQDEEFVNQEDTLSDFWLTIPQENSSKNGQTVFKVHGFVGKYAKLFKKHDARIGIISEGSKRDGEERIGFICDLPKNKTKASFDDERKKKIQIDGINPFSSLSEDEKSSVKDMFGKEIAFDLSGGAPATKAAMTPIQLYSPKLLTISCPQYMPVTENPPVCYFQDFVVKWNADRKNENGVLIIVRWIGSMLFGDNYDTSQVCHTICVPDNGQTTLDESMFEGIPDTAYCHLYVIRGNLENYDIDQLDYQLLTETHDIVNFVLVRNITRNK